VRSANLIPITHTSRPGIVPGLWGGRQQTPARSYQPNCENPKDREDAELCAQWAAVQANGESNRLSRLSIVITGLEFAGLIGSLFFTGWAALAAAKAAKIAEDATAGAAETMCIARSSAAASMRTADAAAEQVRLSREALQLVERAYVTNTAVHFSYRYINGNELQAVSVAIKWENTSNTPALGTRSHLNYSLRMGEPLPTEFDYPDYGEVRDVRSSIGPKSHTNSGDVLLPMDVISGMVTGEIQCFVWGWYEYDDVFEGMPRHRTEFAFQLGINETLFPRDVGFVEKKFGPFNAVDGQCFREPQTAKAG
jgi:hypothetical protein